MRKIDEPNYLTSCRVNISMGIHQLLSGTKVASQIWRQSQQFTPYDSDDDHNHHKGHFFLVSRRSNKKLTSGMLLERLKTLTCFITVKKLILIFKGSG